MVKLQIIDDKLASSESLQNFFLRINLHAFTTVSTGKAAILINADTINLIHFSMKLATSMNGRNALRR